MTTAASASLAITDISNLPVQDQFVINQLGLSSQYDEMLCLVLDERSRELMGEYHRWEDLSRTITLVSRVRHLMLMLHLMLQINIIYAQFHKRSLTLSRPRDNS